MTLIRRCSETDSAAMLVIVNAAAQAYRGVIPADCWHEPYMTPNELEKEIADGVVFWVAEEDERLLGVMGLQDRGEVALVRHAYVTPGAQGKGVGTSLLRHAQGLTHKPILIGTWADASWAIEFYRRNGFTIVPNPHKDFLLRRYWSIPVRQIETSVVLSDGQRLDNRDTMSFSELVAWAWSKTPPVHRNVTNLVIHIFAVPLFVLGHVLALAGILVDGWLALVGVLCIIVSIASQGFGHSIERQHVPPFTGLRDFLRRLYAEQFCNFWRFLFTGQWYLSFKERNDGRAS